MIHIDIEKARIVRERLELEQSLREDRWRKALEAKASFDREMEMKRKGHFLRINTKHSLLKDFDSPFDINVGLY